MRKFVFAGALAASLGLAGCAGTIPNPFTGGSTTISTTDVQNAAVAACGFLPTVATVAAIISAAAGGVGGGIIGTASQAASEICAAIAPLKQAGRHGAAVPTVRGVVVHGRFVR